ncbi:unnamed protein product [Calicophoron daubneyi]|uniref:G-protein coupled receptors family 2 profile 2 domain-containing protein n=1 Tax=Calicophoron daubneyi TaxID=300641 RepID=A0AAV2T2W8_CALDB
MKPLLPQLIVLIIYTGICDGECNSSIILRPTLVRRDHAEWVNTSALLVCPAGPHNTSLWYSPREVYRMTVGLVDEEESSLNLDHFPDVPEITAVFLSQLTGKQTRCVFSSSNGIITAKLVQEDSEAFSDVTLSATVYFRPKATLTNKFFIYIQGRIRNGTCRSHYANGTFDRGQQRIHSNAAYHVITDELKPNNMDRHECFANIDGVYHLISILFKEDTNECKEAERLEIGLCKSSQCIDLLPGYQCADGDYTHEDFCQRRSDWFCPNLATYDYMGQNDCHPNQCVEAANQGIELCDAGLNDCEHQNTSYRCRQGVPLLDACNTLRQIANWSCPKISKDTPDLARFGSNLYRLSYNARSLHDLDPDYFINLTADLTDEKIARDLAAHSGADRHSMATHLIDTFTSTLDEPSLLWPYMYVTPITTHSFTAEPTTMSPVFRDEEFTKETNQALSVTPGMRLASYTIEPSPTSNLTPTKKVKSASAILHMIASIARQTPSVQALLQSGEANRDGVQFWHLPPGQHLTEANSSEGSSVGLFVISDARTRGSDSVVAMVPSGKLTPPHLQSSIPDRLDGLPADHEQRVVLDSDILLVDTVDANSTYRMTMSLPKKPKNSLTCQQLQNQESGTWSSEHCETIIVGLKYECRCSPQQSGTFAVALVYWIGGATIPTEHMHLISLINYIFALITIVALFLFLIFTRFIGVFRLDQFNIAFCLMLSAIVSLAIPHVTDKQAIPCTIIAIAVCYFPLAAFCWKLIFGVNTLILIVAPHSPYHDLVSRQRHCLPLIWTGYVIPAIIVGAWFGCAEKISTGSLCIGPEGFRWPFIGPITAVVIFNFIILIIVGIVLLRSYLNTRASRLGKSMHFLVLTQLMLTLGIPYVAIYIQLLDPYSMLIVVPVAMALTAVLMFLLVAVIDDENRKLLTSFLRSHFTRSSRTVTSQLSQPRQKSGLSSLHSTHSQRTAKPGSPFHNGNHSVGKRWSSRNGQSVKGYSENLQDGRPGDHGEELHTLSEAGETKLHFEPGWLYQYPVVSPNKQNVVVIPEEPPVVVQNSAQNNNAYPSVPSTAVSGNGTSHSVGTYPRLPPSYDNVILSNRRPLSAGDRTYL